MTAIERALAGLAWGIAGPSVHTSDAACIVNEHVMSLQVVVLEHSKGTVTLRLYLTCWSKLREKNLQAWTLDRWTLPIEAPGSNGASIVLIGSATALPVPVGIQPFE
ncbi:hypothetical protein HYFRA_00010947 [Hymenoscyphus fraxineus]|uniref:Uncharacterized protein n=1 Tax=Hymenoscyphus fraxineus TaxID=746836 RepID=A0A9N9L152_9HELO|nr:hypothetical protein HYFRA_00010947 [Hymenoscyphus fraxineus]